MEKLRDKMNYRELIGFKEDVNQLCEKWMRPFGADYSVALELAIYKWAVERFLMPNHTEERRLREEQFSKKNKEYLNQ